MKSRLRSKLGKNTTEEFLETMDKMAKKVGKDRDTFIVESFIKFMDNDLSEDDRPSPVLLDLVKAQKAKLKH